MCQFINCEERDPGPTHSVRDMCTWLGVNRSSYYGWKTRGESATAARRKQITTMIVQIFTASDSTYGYRRIAAELARRHRPADAGVVRSIMREQGLVAATPKRKHPITTIAADAGAIPDLIKREFSAEAPGQRLCGDITYIRTSEGWVYLATVLDFFSKKVVGYAMADNMRTELVITALEMAVRNLPRHGGNPIVYHSDHGVQYTSQAFADACGKLGVQRPVGRTGVCWDNAWAESFNATLKKERCHRAHYLTREEAVRDVTGYIELWYNQRRIHSALGYHTPNEAEHEWCQNRRAA
jgi:transposase InsO family protein